MIGYKRIVAREITNGVMIYSDKSQQNMIESGTKKR
jgi:hypothetical protein